MSMTSKDVRAGVRESSRFVAVWPIPYDLLSEASKLPSKAAMPKPAKTWLPRTRISRREGSVWIASMDFLVAIGYSSCGFYRDRQYKLNILITALLCSTPTHSSSFQPTPAKVRFSHKLGWTWPE